MKALWSAAVLGFALVLTSSCSGGGALPSSGAQTNVQQVTPPAKHLPNGCQQDTGGSSTGDCIGITIKHHRHSRA